MLIQSHFLVLIETYWNVKRDVVDAMQKTRQCINRNILECKEWIQEDKTNVDRSINRNILECKVRWQDEFNQVYEVLIETYWNVKDKNAIKMTALDMSTNRNILECKVLCRHRSLEWDLRINRNILECKDYRKDGEW